MPQMLRLPALLGGGLVLGYDCQSRCRHCLYGCGAHRRDGKPAPAELEHVLDLLAELGPDARYHIGGGEPFLDLPLLEQAVAGMTARGLQLDYVETNAGWVKSAEQAERTLSELARAGLDCVLVSLSPFHAEFTPPHKTRTLIAAANKLLRGGAFVWIPEFAPDLAGCSDQQKLDLTALLAARGDRYALSIADRYGLVPAGRAGRYMHRHGRRLAFGEIVERAPCRVRLLDTSHFHVDGQARYVPGLCSGLCLPLDRLRRPIDLGACPVLRTLLQERGLAKLVSRARDLGFEPFETYSSACDLCSHVRVFLFDEEASPDLGPEGFYDSRSLPDFSSG
jgi:hypothetical protein